MPAVSLQQAFDLALQHHQAGQFAEAESIYRQILDVNPEQAEALHLLGVLAAQSGRLDVALPLIVKAVSLEPVNPTFRASLDELFRRLRQPAEAVDNVHRDPGALQDQNQLGTTPAADRQAIVPAGGQPVVE